MHISWIIGVIGISALLQLATAVFAFRLIRLTGVRIAWIFISLGFVLMAVRRAITMAQLLSGYPPAPFDLAVTRKVVVI